MSAEVPMFTEECDADSDPDYGWWCGIYSNNYEQLISKKRYGCRWTWEAIQHYT